MFLEHFMTKKGIAKRIALFIFILSLVFLFSACDETEKNKLNTPDVTLSDTGIASWDYVPNAEKYVYQINGGELAETQRLWIQLSDGDTIIVRAVSSSAAYLDSNWSISVTYNPIDLPIILDTPSVSISDDGVASWGAVAGASQYAYKINNSTSVLTDALSVQLSDGDTVSVKAINGSKNAESEWSTPKNYTAKTTTDESKTELNAPNVQISENGIASWQKVEGASSYTYIINGGEPKNTSELSVQLSDGDSITVKAIGNDKYSDSNYSIAKTFDCTHKDQNGDGSCDNCYVKVRVILDIYALNDLHGSFMDTDDQPGVDEFMTYLFQKYEDDAAYELLISSGDMWQGTVESSSNKGMLMTEWMNLMGFASMTVGNHEFDWGIDYIESNSEIANFPFLAINLRYNGERPDFIKSSVIVEKGGLKIGIIGAIGDVRNSISGEFTSGLEFISGSALTSLVQSEAKRLRSDEGCDIVVYSIHDNNESYDFELSNKNSGKGYVDVVFEGHTHTRYVETDKYGVVHIQAGGYNKAISYVSFSYDLMSGEYFVKEKSLIYNSVYGNSSIDGHEAVDQIYDKYFSENDPYTTVLGYNGVYMSSSDIESLVTSLYLEYGKERWESYDIALAAASINVRTPGNLPSGAVTYSQIFQLLPFDNSIILGKMRGSDINKKVLSSGQLDYTLGSAASFNKDEYYYIITDSYCAYYSYNNIEIVDKIDLDIYARDLVAEYVKESYKPEAPISKTVAEIISENKSAIYETEATVIAVNAQSFLISDGTGEILVYKGKSWTCELEIGDKLSITGTTSFFGGNIQFGADTSYSKITSEPVSYPAFVKYDATKIAALTTPFSPVYAELTGVLKIVESGPYYNLYIDGTTRVGSINYPSQDIVDALEQLNGTLITVRGYITSITSDKYVNMIVVSLIQ
jgi:2',3'-cyclic-nucleotide 2'-phosphodiesterase/3'-nucleotidase